MCIKHPFMFVPVLAILNHFHPTAKFECESSECLLFLLVVDFFWLCFNVCDFKLPVNSMECKDCVSGQIEYANSSICD